MGFKYLAACSYKVLAFERSQHNHRYSMAALKDEPKVYMLLKKLSTIFFNDCHYLLHPQEAAFAHFNHPRYGDPILVGNNLPLMGHGLLLQEPSAFVFGRNDLSGR